MIVKTIGTCTLEKTDDGRLIVGLKDCTSQSPCMCADGRLAWDGYVPISAKRAARAEFNRALRSGYKNRYTNDRRLIV